MRILLAVDFDVELHLLEGMIRAGHDIVDRVTGASALVAAVAAHRPDAVVASAGPETLTAHSLAACDAAGARTIAVIGADEERRQANRLGVVDRIDAAADWGAVQALLDGGAVGHTPGGARRAASSLGEQDAGASPSGGREQDAGAGRPAEAAAAGTAGGAGGAAAGAGGGTGIDSAGEVRRRDLRQPHREARQQRDTRRGLRARRTAAPRNDPHTQSAAAQAAAAPSAPAHSALAEEALAQGAVTRDAAAHVHGPRMAAESMSGGQDAGRTEPARPPGTVVAVWGPHGAPGTTTVAIALAGALTNLGLRTLLIDADTYGGAIAASLGIADEAPGLAAACRLAGAASLNRDELDRVSSPVSCRGGELRVLTGISNPARWPELAAARVSAVLDEARAQFDACVVDVGFNLERDEELVSDIAAPRRNAAAHATLRAAGAVVAVGEATPVGMHRYLRARLSLGDLLDEGTSVLTVINRVRAAVTGADSAGQVRQVLLRFGGIEHATLLPDDPRAADRALAEAQPVVDAASRSQLTRGLTALALQVRAHIPAAAALPPRRTRRR